MRTRKLLVKMKTMMIPFSISKPLFLITMLAGAFGGSLGSAQDQTESKRLAELKEIYDQEILKVTDPIDVQYEKSLVRLQQFYVSKNMLEEAIMVKEEIKKVQSKKALEESLARVATPTPPAATTVPEVEPEKMAAANDEKTSGWKGDHKVVEENGEVVFQLTGKEESTTLITRPIESIKENYPNGLRIRFKYKSDDFAGTGIELRAEFPTLRGMFTYRNPTVVFDGEWNEYTWPFSDTKGQDMMNFQIHLENGTGTVSFKDIEFLAN